MADSDGQKARRTELYDHFLYFPISFTIYWFPNSSQPFRLFPDFQEFFFRLPVSYVFLFSKIFRRDVFLLSKFNRQPSIGLHCFPFALLYRTISSSNALTDIHDGQFCNSFKDRRRGQICFKSHYFLKYTYIHHMDV